jgi:hypothetical protein
MRKWVQFKCGHYGYLNQDGRKMRGRLPCVKFFCLDCYDGRVKLRFRLNPATAFFEGVCK